MATRRNTGSTGGRSARQGKATQEKQADLSKFLDPEAADKATEEVEEQEQEQDTTTPEADAEVEEGDSTLEEDSEGPEEEPNETDTTEADAEEGNGEVVVRVLNDALITRPGHIVTKGETVSLPAEVVARLVRLGAVEQA